MGEKPFDPESEKINTDPIIQFQDIASNNAIFESLESVEEIYKK